MDVTLIETLLILVTGLSFGSFATMASHRLPREEGIVRKPSHCPVCNNKLGIKDLFPVLSWVVQKGKCRYCGARIHYRYPLIELCTAALFLFLYWQFGFSVPSALLMLFGVCMVIFFVTDFEHKIIPDEVQIAMLVLGVAYRLITGIALADIIAGFVMGLGIGLALRYGYSFLRNREGLGLGDVKFLAVAGIWLNLEAWPVFMFFSGVLGVVTALIWRVIRKEKEFPFGPALGASLFLCVIFPETADFFRTMVN